jgi:hypothetical protein
MSVDFANAFVVSANWATAVVQYGALCVTAAAFSIPRVDVGLRGVVLRLVSRVGQ